MSDAADDDTPSSTTEASADAPTTEAVAFVQIPRGDSESILGSREREEGTTFLSRDTDAPDDGED